MLEHFLHSMEVMAEIFLLTGAGYLCRRLRVLSDAVLDGCMEFLMKLAVPAQLLAAAATFAFTPETLASIALLLLITLLGYLANILITLVISKALRLPERERIVLQGTVVFKNIAFLGFPVCSAILGQQSLFYAAFCMMMFNIFMWTYGIRLYSNGRERGMKALLTNPALICCALMVLLALFQVRLPDIVQQALEVTGNTCTPLSLVVIGMMLADSDLKALLHKPLLWLISGLSLAAFPLLMLALTLVLRPGLEASAVLVTLACVPAATLNPIVARQYGADSNLVSFSVMHTMLLSLITMPIFISLFLSVLGYGA